MRWGALPRYWERAGMLVFLCRDKDTLVAPGLPGPPRSAKAGSTGNRLSSSTMCNRRSVGDEVLATPRRGVPRALPTLCRTLRPTLRRLRFVHPLGRLHLGNQPATLCIGGPSLFPPLASKKKRAASAVWPQTWRAQASSVARACARRGRFLSLLRTAGSRPDLKLSLT